MTIPGQKALDSYTLADRLELNNDQMMSNDSRPHCAFAFMGISVEPLQLQR
jgi:hypothetical protein